MIATLGADYVELITLEDDPQDGHVWHLVVLNLPETNISSLKIDGWKTILSFWVENFQGRSIHESFVQPLEVWEFDWILDILGSVSVNI